jgi:hypothetical protein
VQQRWAWGKRSSISRALPLVAAVVFCLVGVPAYAAPGRLVQQRFVSEAADKQLEDVLYLALGVELSNAGLSSTKIDKDASYFLDTSYESRGEEADVRLTLSKVRPQAVLASVDFTLHIDSSFDADIAEGVRRLLALAAPALAAPGEKADAPEISGLFPSGLVSLDDMLRTDRTLRLEMAASGGGAPFLGDFSEYSAYGAYGSAQAGALFLKRNWSLSVGGRFSFTRAFMADGVSGGPLYLSTAGVNLQYGLGAAQSIKLAACASGGAAVITVPNGGSLLSKTVPYADAGVQAGFPVGKDLFLGCDLRFMAVFDPDVLILGTVVAVSICKEF